MEVEMKIIYIKFANKLRILIRFSIFLHLRSLMQITGYSALKQSLFRVIQLTNIIT